jgi:hypothetical protein
MTNQEFSEIVRRALERGAFEGERHLGQRFGVCRTQVMRWKEGRSCPLPVVRRKVAQVMRERIANT